MSSQPPCALLVSGGLDSTTLAYDLAQQDRNVLPVFVDYGQHCARRELSTARRVLPECYVGRLQVIDVQSVYEGCSSRLVRAADLWSEGVTAKELYLPYRSLLLLSVGAAFANGHDIRELYAAFIDSNHATEIDCSSAFFGTLAKLLAAHGGVSLTLPYRAMTKLDVVRRALALGAPFAETFSCQAAAEIPCGACPNCVDRIDALDALREDFERRPREPL